VTRHRIRLKRRLRILQHPDRQRPTRHRRVIPGRSIPIIKTPRHRPSPHHHPLPQHLSRHRLHPTRGIHIRHPMPQPEPTQIRLDPRRLDRQHRLIRPRHPHQRLLLPHRPRPTTRDRTTTRPPHRRSRRHRNSRTIRRDPHQTPQVHHRRTHQPHILIRRHLPRRQRHRRSRSRNRPRRSTRGNNWTGERLGRRGQRPRKVAVNRWKLGALHSVFRHLVLSLSTRQF
jgi:hypothetical protein